MNTTAITNAPMVRIQPRFRFRARQSLEALMDEVRLTSPAWWARFEDANLSVVGSADPRTVAALAADAPSERLAGIVEGLYLNN